MAEKYTYTQTSGGYFRNPDGAGPYVKDEDGNYNLMGASSSNGLEEELEDVKKKLVESEGKLATANSEIVTLKASLAECEAAKE